MRIAVLTSTRADYGLLRWVIKELQSYDEIVVELIVTGTHFLEEFGSTWKEIRDDGYQISYRVDILTGGDSPLSVAQSTGTAVGKIAAVIDEANIDMLVLLGDRYEAMAAALASFLVGVPVAHIAGGELTEGALDDSLRHAITKLASLHFVSAEEYGNRVKQLGENPNHVYNVGATGLDNFKNLQILDYEALSQLLGFDVEKHPFVLFTFHPVTAEDAHDLEVVTTALRLFNNYEDLKVVVTGANADAGGRSLNSLYRVFEEVNAEKFHVFASLGQVGYLSAMLRCAAVIGNSSSGILEAPSAGVPTLNIGDRQRGRLRAPSVVDVGIAEGEIAAGIAKVLSPEMRELALLRQSPFGEAGASAEIARVIASTSFSDLLPKQFFSK